MTGPRLAFDIETDGLLHQCTRIWVLAIGDLDTKEVVTYTDHDPAYPPLSEGIDRLMSASLLVAHNGIGFDRPAIYKITGKWLPGKLRDTLIMGRLFNPERQGGHRLEGYGIELGVLKGTYGKDDENAWAAYNEEMRSYCGQDVVVTLALYDKLKVVEEWGESCDLEHRVAELIELQMANGFGLDVRAGMMLAAELSDERVRLMLDLQNVFPPILVGAGEFTPKRDNAKMGYCAGAPLTKLVMQEFNPGSEFHVAARLKRKYGWIAPLTDKGNPNITEAVLKKLDFDEAKLLLRFSRVDKMWTQLAAPPKKNGKGGGWLHHADENGKVHGYVNPNGAVTGRMTHSRPNSANIDGDARMRALWVPTPSPITKAVRVLCGIDAEGLELRMLGHYLAKHDGGEFTKAVLFGDKSKGTDAHSRNRDYATLYSRDGAKTMIYALIYGAGDPKLGATWVADWQASGKPKEEWPQWAFKGRGQQRQLRALAAIGKQVRANLVSGIKGFEDLLKGVKKQAEQRGWLRGLDGRRIRVRSPHSALNALLQGGGAIVMKRGLVILHDDLTAAPHQYVHGDHFGYCANVHDEWQIECLPSIAPAIGEAGKQAITKAGEHYGLRCRLDGAYDIGTNWHETH